MPVIKTANDDWVTIAPQDSAAIGIEISSSDGYLASVEMTPEEMTKLRNVLDGYLTPPPSTPFDDASEAIYTMDGGRRFDEEWDINLPISTPRENNSFVQYLALAAVSTGDFSQVKTFVRSNGRRL